MRRIPMLLIAAALVLAAPSAALAGPKTFKEKAQAFLASLKEETNLRDGAVAELEAEWAKLSAKTDLDPNADFIGEGLLMAFPQYARAIRSWDRQYFKKAQTRLARVAAESDNDYVLAHTNYFMARIHLEQGRYERAEGILSELVASEMEFIHRDYEVAFYLGLAQGQLLWREKAQKTFDAFVKSYPKAPERYRMLAKKIAAELKVRGENELYDLADRMSLVQRWLSKQNTGKPTQKQQGEIVDILKRLIKMAEEKEKNCQGGGGGGGGGGGQGGGPAQGTGRPGSPATSPNLPSGPSRPEHLARRAAKNVGRAWGMMGEKDRKKITQFLQKNFPERYRHLLKQYYSELSKGK